VKLRLFLSLLLLSGAVFAQPILAVKAATVTSIADLTATTSTPTPTASPVITATPTPVVATATPDPTSTLPNTGINLAAVLGFASLGMIALSVYQLLRRSRA